MSKIKSLVTILANFHSNVTSFFVDTVLVSAYSAFVPLCPWFSRKIVDFLFSHLTEHRNGEHSCES